MGDVARAFRELPYPAAPSPGSLAFAGATIPDTEHRIAKDHNGRPVLLIRATTRGGRIASIQLRNLRVEHNVRCRIALSSGVIDDRFSMIHWVLSWARWSKREGGLNAQI